MIDKESKRLILCAGLQSSGTTLVSWCFLQRLDTNGVLDMPHDTLQVSFEKVEEPIVWCKMTIGAFRWLDVYETYCDLGWQPEPLLVVRDVRAAFSSLITKEYGFNGTTAEEPPLRMRFRRFLRDWELFRANGWPILKYEDFIQDGRSVLPKICSALTLSWDEGMIAWPKKLSQIAYVGPDPNQTFLKSIEKGSLTAAKLPDKVLIQIDQLSQTELRWLEKTFAAYNDYHHYPLKIGPATRSNNPTYLGPPRFEGTARQWYYSENDRLRSENERLLREKKGDEK